MRDWGSEDEQTRKVERCCVGFFCKESAPWRKSSKEIVNRHGEGKRQGKGRGQLSDRHLDYATQVV